MCESLFYSSMANQRMGRNRTIYVYHFTSHWYWLCKAYCPSNASKQFQNIQVLLQPHCVCLYRYKGTIFTRYVPYVWNASPKTDDCQFYDRILLQSLAQSDGRTVGRLLTQSSTNFSVFCALSAHKTFSACLCVCVCVSAASAATAATAPALSTRFLSFSHLTLHQFRSLAFCYKT